MQKLFLLISFLLFVCSPAWADCSHRLSVGAGLTHIADPSETSFSIGAEYECRMNPIVGVGGFANYIFTDPGITHVGAPEVFIHPLGGDFYVAASPLVEFGSRVGTHFGARVSSLLPIPLGVLILVPSFAVDFIRGTQIYWFGLGISI